MSLLVTAVMLTRNRPQYVPLAIAQFLDQTYANCELMILDDGDPVVVPQHPRIAYRHLDKTQTIGGKRNIGCGLASGDVIVNWDDDDWSHSDRIATQVARLQSSGKQLTGYNELLYWNEPDGKTYKFVCKEPYAAGSSQCFYRAWWEGHRYPNIQSGEDQAMSMMAAKAGQLDCQDGGQMLVARAHFGNTWKPPLGNWEFPEWDRAAFPSEFFE